MSVTHPIMPVSQFSRQLGKLYDEFLGCMINGDDVHSLVARLEAVVDTVSPRGQVTALPPADAAVGSIMASNIRTISLLAHELAKESEATMDRLTEKLEHLLTKGEFCIE